MVRRKTTKKRTVRRKSKPKVARITSFKDKHGFLVKVTNSIGRKKPVYLGQGLKGWHALYSKSFRKVNNKNIRSPERYAKKLAKRGHRLVEIRD